MPAISFSRVSCCSVLGAGFFEPVPRAETGCLLPALLLVAVFLLELDLVFDWVLTLMIGS